MKIPFLDKLNDDVPDYEPNDASDAIAIIPIGEAEIEQTDYGAALDIELHEHVTFAHLGDGSSGIGGAEYADALIPMAGNVVNAAAQYNQAIVRFPEGAGWGDLLNRKTPGWEEWKQLGILKDGRFQTQAAIRQAKLQPVAVANLALQGAAIIVGQAYMAEISKQLEGIQSEISAIQNEMRLERESDIEASFELLQEYVSFFGEISGSPQRRQAVHGAIEGIKKDARAAWDFQLKAMGVMCEELLVAKKMKNEDLAKRINGFRRCEREAMAAFRLLVAVEQTSMQYDNDFSPRRIAYEREILSKGLEQYKVERDGVQKMLGERIDAMKDSPLKIAKIQDDSYEANNPLAGAVHTVKTNASRIWLPAMRQEAERSLDEKKQRWNSVAMVANPLESLGDNRDEDLKRLDFVYNRADAMIVDEMGIHFVRLADDERGKSAFDSEEQQG